MKHTDKKVLTIAVPAGIGDISWAYSQLCTDDEVDLHLLVPDGWPHRSVEYCNLLPKVVQANYEKFQYSDIIVYERANQFGTWKEYKECGHGIIYMEPNEHLGMGKPLKDWLPDLGVDYHYEMESTNGSRKEAKKLFKKARRARWWGNEKTPRPWIGVSAASYRGSEAWKTWNRKKWKRFLKMVTKHTGGTVWLLGGFWDDLTFSLAEDHKDLVGKTSASCLVEILKQLDCYVGFSSGLGVMATVLRKPTFMMWPDHQLPLSTAWADPEQVADKSYMAYRWIQPEEVFNAFKSFLRLNNIN